MLPKINRLKNTKDIERVFKNGKGFRGGSLFLKLVQNNLNTSRFAFIVSKKTVKKAARRNQIKRRLRNIIKKEMPRIKIGLDMVVIVQKGAESRDSKVIKEETEAVLRKANLFI